MYFQVAVAAVAVLLSVTVFQVSALNCYTCSNNTLTGEDCRSVKSHQLLQCTPGHDDVCVTRASTETGNPDASSTLITRYCARLIRANGDSVSSNKNVHRTECNSILEGNKVIMNCQCNYDGCNSHLNLYLPDGRYFAGAASHATMATSALIMAAVARMLF